MDSDTMMYIFTTGMIALLAIFILDKFGPFGIIVIIFALLAIVLILIIAFADFVIFPLVTSILNIKTIPAKDYYIPKKQDCVIKNINGLYYATGYLTANIYNYVFVAEKNTQDDSELIDSPETWERIIMNTKFPFKFHMITVAEEIQKFREEIEGKRSWWEVQLSREMSTANPHELTIEDLQKKVNIEQARLDKISAGDRPLDAIMYIETTAFGVSEKAAMDQLNEQINQLQTMFVGFNLSVIRIVGRELYIVFNFSYRIPITAGKMSSIFNLQA
jgi:hypothetical protein